MLPPVSHSFQLSGKPHSVHYFQNLLFDKQYFVIKNAA